MTQTPPPSPNPFFKAVHFLRVPYKKYLEHRAEVEALCTHGSYEPNVNAVLLFTEDLERCEALFDLLGLPRAVVP